VARGSAERPEMMRNSRRARGFVVFAIDYRHAPQWPWPAQIEDVRAALGWVREHGGEYGADVSRLALLGRSAGAQLAMVAAYELGTVPIIPVMPIRASSATTVRSI
jgi:acetyl esterase/lipase